MVPYGSRRTMPKQSGLSQALARRTGALARLTGGEPVTGDRTTESALRDLLAAVLAALDAPAATPADLITRSARADHAVNILRMTLAEPVWLPGDYKLAADSLRALTAAQPAGGQR